MAKRIARKPARKVTLARRPPALPVPKFIKPQLCKLTEIAPEGEGWIYEVKLDGYRMAARIDGGKVQLITRGGHDWTAKYPALAKAIKALKLKSAYIDGEMCAIDDEGLPNFALTQNAHEGEATIVYYAFDLLHLSGEDLTGLPLQERKDRLAPIVTDRHGIQFNANLPGPGADILAQACEMGLEGIVAKRADAAYSPDDRSGIWFKIKCRKRQEFVIVGWTDPEGSRPGFGALLLGYYEGKKLHYAGRVGTGFSDKLLTEILRKLKPLEIDKMPISAPPPKSLWGKPLRPATTHWTKPKLVAEVNYGTWEGDGLLRHTSFIGLSADKAAAKVRREA